MLNLRKLLKTYKETGTLSEHISVFGFIDDSCFITKTGHIGAVIELQGIDYECLDQQTIDNRTQRLEAAFKLFGPEYRVHQYLFKSHFEPSEPPQYDNPVVNRAEQERYQYFVERSDDLFTMRQYYVVLYSAPSKATKITFAKALASLFTHGPKAAADNFQALISGRKEILLIEEEIDQARTILLRSANSFVSALSDLVDIKVLDKNSAFRMLRRLLNLDPDKLKNDRLKYDTLTDKFLAGAPVESYPDHLTIDGYYTRILTLREEPSESWPLILAQLYQVKAAFNIATEWRPLENREAVKYIESMRNHFHKTKNAPSTTSGGDRLKDETKQDFVSDLNECLKEVQKKGNYFGKFTLTILIYDQDQAKVEKAVSDFNKVFSRNGAALYYETYNQLSAFFAMQPGNGHFNFRQLVISNNNYADWSFLFTLHEGQQWNTYLDREALAIVETEHGTPFYLNLHQRIHDGTGTTSHDVAHSLITGGTGSGKSFFCNFLLLALQKYQPRTFIFDVGDSYQKLTNLLGGSYLKVADLTNSLRINPFSLEPTPNNREFLFAFINVLLAGPDNYQINIHDERNIYNGIDNLYAVDPEVRRLESFASTIPKHLSERLHKWISGGQYGHLFDNNIDNLELSTFQCFEFKGMEKSQQLVEALLFYVLHRASDVIYNPAIASTLKIFLLDEAWKFFTIPAIREYLVSAAKTWRKHNGVLIMATQSPEDLKTANLLPVLSSLPTKIFLADADADYDLYQEKFRLNERELKLIRGLIPKREGIIKTSNMAKKFTLNTDRKSYWLYTNSPKDNERFLATFNQYGFDRALELLAARS